MQCCPQVAVLGNWHRAPYKACNDNTQRSEQGLFQRLAFFPTPCFSVTVWEREKINKVQRLCNFPCERDETVFTLILRNTNNTFITLQRCFSVKIYWQDNTSASRRIWTSWCNFPVLFFLSCQCFWSPSFSVFFYLERTNSGRQNSRFISDISSVWFEHEKAADVPWPEDSTPKFAL